MTTAGASPAMFFTAFCKKYNACGMPFFFLLVSDEIMV